MNSSEEVGITVKGLAVGVGISAIFWFIIGMILFYV